MRISILHRLAVILVAFALAFALPTFADQAPADPTPATWVQSLLDWIAQGLGWAPATSDHDAPADDADDGQDNGLDDEADDLARGTFVILPGG